MEDYIIELARKYYEKCGNSSGGSLHIVLDDGNVSDHNVRYCREYAIKNGDADGVVLADALLYLSIEQRRKVYAQYSLYAG